MQDRIILNVTKEEFEYIRTVLFNLSRVENKIPKKMKSRNSIILKELNNRFSKDIISE